ncbi:MAG: 2-C-methyl-D-erythritol 4-phosphate cytidylyltransferase [bacterium]
MHLPPAETVGAVVPAAGEGRRLPGATAKQFRRLAGAPMLWHTLRRLAGAGAIGRIVLVLPPSEIEGFALPGDLPVPVDVAAGGPRRQDSVSNGLAALPPQIEWVAVHDGARPLLPPALVADCLAAARGSGAAIAALPASDTVKRADGEGFSQETLPRSGLWLAQTPQVARRDLLARALEAAAARGLEGADEAALLEAIGVRVKMVPGSRENLKITSPDDLALAEALLARAASPAGGAP